MIRWRRDIRHCDVLLAPGAVGGEWVPIAQSRRGWPPEPSKALGANARTLITNKPATTACRWIADHQLASAGRDDCDAGNALSMSGGSTGHPFADKRHYVN
jgi:hypothetical protein